MIMKHYSDKDIWWFLIRAELLSQFYEIDNMERYKRMLLLFLSDSNFKNRCIKMLA